MSEAKTSSEELPRADEESVAKAKEGVLATRSPAQSSATSTKEASHTGTRPMRGLWAAASTAEENTTPSAAPAKAQESSARPSSIAPFPAAAGAPAPKAPAPLDLHPDFDDDLAFAESERTVAVPEMAQVLTRASAADAMARASMAAAPKPQAPGRPSTAKLPAVSTSREAPRESAARASHSPAPPSVRADAPDSPSAGETSPKPALEELDLTLFLGKSAAAGLSSEKLQELQAQSRRADALLRQSESGGEDSFGDEGKTRVQAPDVPMSFPAALRPNLGSPASQAGRGAPNPAKLKDAAPAKLSEAPPLLLDLGPDDATTDSPPLSFGPGSGEREGKPRSLSGPSAPARPGAAPRPSSAEAARQNAEREAAKAPKFQRSLSAAFTVPTASSPRPPDPRPAPAAGANLREAAAGKADRGLRSGSTLGAAPPAPPERPRASAAGQTPAEARSSHTGQPSAPARGSNPGQPAALRDSAPGKRPGSRGSTPGQAPASRGSSPGPLPESSLPRKRESVPGTLGSPPSRPGLPAAESRASAPAPSPSAPSSPSSLRLDALDEPSASILLKDLLPTTGAPRASTPPLSLDPSPEASSPKPLERISEVEAALALSPLSESGAPPSLPNYLLDARPIIEPPTTVSGSRSRRDLPQRRGLSAPQETKAKLPPPTPTFLGGDEDDRANDAELSPPFSAPIPVEDDLPSMPELTPMRSAELSDVSNETLVQPAPPEAAAEAAVMQLLEPLFDEAASAEPLLDTPYRAAPSAPRLRERRGRSSTWLVVGGTLLLLALLAGLGVLWWMKRGGAAQVEGEQEETTSLSPALSARLEEEEKRFALEDKRASGEALQRILALGEGKLPSALAARQLLWNAVVQLRFGKAAQENEALSAARKRLESSTSSDPLLRLALAADQLMRGDLQAASALQGLSLPKAQQGVFAWLQGEAALRANKPAQASELFARASQAGFQPAAEWGSVRAFEARGEAPPSTLLATILRLNPRHFAAKVAQTRAQFERTGDPALVDLLGGNRSKAIASWPEFDAAPSDAAKAWVLIGDARLAEGTLGQSADAYQRALVLHKDDAAAQKGLAQVMLDARDPHQALLWARKAQSSGKGRVVDQARIVELRALSETDKAEEGLRKFESYFPKADQDPKLLVLKGRLERGAGNPGGAEALYQRALEMAPENLEAHFALAEHYFLADQNFPANRTLKKASANTTATAAVYAALGDMLLKVSKPWKAQEAYSQALLRNETHSHAMAGLYLAYKSSGREDKALTTLEELRKVDPTFPNLQKL